MRLWSIHPKYLDRQGLLGVWREGLLAQKVLLGKTKAYKNHPQLERFNIQTLQQYLHYICDEGINRNYNFNRKLIEEKKRLNYRLSVTTEQLKYEFELLQDKLIIRNQESLYWDNEELRNEKEIEPNPLFKIIIGDIEKWEKIK